jgi:hypothetical protein
VERKALEGELRTVLLAARAHHILPRRLADRHLSFFQVAPHTPSTTSSPQPRHRNHPDCAAIDTRCHRRTVASPLNVISSSRYAPLDHALKSLRCVVAVAPIRRRPSLEPLFYKDTRPTSCVQEVKATPIARASARASAPSIVAETRTTPTTQHLRVLEIATTCAPEPTVTIKTKTIARQCTDLEAQTLIGLNQAGTAARFALVRSSASVLLKPLLRTTPSTTAVLLSELVAGEIQTVRTPIGRSM